MIQDRFPQRPQDPSQPVEGAAAVAPSNTENLPFVTRALYVGTGGNLRVTLKRGETVTFNNVLSGSFLPIRATRIWATGTTAANLIALD